EEMANTFVAFFDWNSNVSININVDCEYYPDEILVRYYADEGIDQSNFEKILATKVPKFLEFLRDQQIFMKDYITKKEGNKDISKLLQDIDTYRMCVSLRTGIASRALLDQDWTLDETIKLVKAIC